MKRYINAAVALFQDQDTGARFEIARDTSSERDIREIARTENTNTVLMALAYNKNTPPDVLLDLAGRGDEQVAKYALRNPNASTELIDQLYRSSFDVGKYTREYVDREASDTCVHADQEFFRKCALSSIPHIRCLVAGNWAADEDVQNMLVNDSNYEVLWALVNNRLIYKSCLDKLAQSTDDDIKQEAIARLAEEDYIIS